MTTNQGASQQFSARSEERAATRAAGVVGFWTALSRIFGFLRDVVIANYLGAGPWADAFFVAFRIPNLLRRLFGEGALSAAFVPTFVETLHHQGGKKAEKLARETLTFAALVLLAVTILGMMFSPWIVRLIAPGFLDEPAKYGLTVSLNRIMFPYIFFVSLVALASGILNSVGHFFAPAAAPIILNLSMILSVALFTTFFGVPPQYALAWGVVSAGVLQLLLQLPFMEARGIRWRPDFHFRDPALRRIGRLFIPAALAGAVYQVNVMVGTILASMLPTGSVSWLYYADRLVELPLGVFAIALGTAVLPSMSRLAATGDRPGLRQSLSYSLRLIAFFTIPASLGLIILRVPVIACLFQRGHFGPEDSAQTALALLWYTVGLWAFSGLKVVNQCFFSLKDTVTPLIVAVGAVIVNLAAGLLLMGVMAHGGLALAASLAAAFNVVTLFVILVRRLGGFPLAEFAVSICRITVASGVMALLIAVMNRFGHWERGLDIHNGLLLAAMVAGGLAVFGISAYVLRSPELGRIMEMVRRTERSR